MNNQKKIILIGGGGHASVIAEILLAQSIHIEAVVCPEMNSVSAHILQGVTHLKNDDDILNYCPSMFDLVNGIGMLPYSSIRNKVTSFFISKGYNFRAVISSDAVVSPSAEIASGAQILTASIIQAGARVGAHTIVNSGALVEHDCIIGSHSHVGPRAVICGGVTIGEHAFIGANATLVPSISVGDKSIVGAGVTLTKSLAEKMIYYPAKGALVAL